MSKAKLTGKVAVITGANSGIGRVCAAELSRRGAKVVILCRSREKGLAAAKEITRETTGADSGEVVFRQLDLASLASVRACADQLRAELDRLDILLNNAGIMTPPLARTKDGFESQFGTNHLGKISINREFHNHYSSTCFFQR